MLIPVLLFILGLVLLIKGGDWFVDGASNIAQRLHVPELIIGATVVSIGTTLPEVMVSATSAVTGHGQIAYGNAVGSIICNTAFISALTVAIRPSEVDRKTFRLPVFFFFATSVYYFYNAYSTGYFSKETGLILLGIFLVYMIAASIQAKVRQSRLSEEISEEAQSKKKGSAFKDILFLIIGAALIAVGAKLLVENGTLIAQYLGVPEAVIALTFVALGTSLPELVTAISALIKGHGALSLGNIIGANLFNMVLVSGISAVLAPFEIPDNGTIFGVNSSLVVDLPLMLLVMTILTIPTLIRGKLKRSQGIILLLLYAGFCAFEFMY